MILKSTEVMHLVLENDNFLNKMYSRVISLMNYVIIFNNYGK